MKIVRVAPVADDRSGIKRFLNRSEPRLRDRPAAVSRTGSGCRAHARHPVRENCLGYRESPA